MLPTAVLLLKLLFVAQGVSLVLIGAESVNALKASHVALPGGTAHPRVLLGYRLAVLALAIAVAVRQLIIRGPVVFVYFTIWNWYLLIAYFAAASWSTYAAIRDGKGNGNGNSDGTRNEKGRPRRAPQRRSARLSSSNNNNNSDNDNADFVHKLAATLFHIALPVALAVDVTTWFILVPMLMKDPDPVSRRRWTELMFSFSSYMQHGGNLVMVLGDLALNDIPLLTWWGKGWVTMWATLYLSWSIVYFVSTGKFIYPFLNFYKPTALSMFAGLFISYWVTFLALVACIKLRTRIRRRHLER